MTPLAVFLSSFISVFALGFQSQNVNQGHYVAAFITSFAIGGGTLVLYKVLPDGTWLDTVAYLIGGATGIVCAMWAHRRTLGKRHNTTEPPPTAAARPEKRGLWESLSIELQHREQLHKAVRAAIIDIEAERLIARGMPRSPLRD